MLLSTGETLNNRYRIVKLLGQGGFGAVYRAWDTAVNQPCAVKENLDASPEAQRQFQREASILAGLRHPNLPRVTDYFFIQGQGQYLVMDFVEGQSLDFILAQNGGPLDEITALPWMLQVCSALAYLHAQTPPVIHRDVKPQNIIITPRGQAMLVDFGISKIFDAALRTTTGAKAVTPGYSPPEQYGNARTDNRSDIYALGATLYEMVTGKCPPDAIDRMVHGIGMHTPSELTPKVSVPLEQAILRAMALEPQARFQTVIELQSALKPQSMILQKSGEAAALPAMAWAICWNCQFTNRPGANNCANCGAPLHQRQAAQPPALQPVSPSSQHNAAGVQAGGVPLTPVITGFQASAPVAAGRRPRGATIVGIFSILTGWAGLIAFGAGLPAMISGIGMLLGKNWARRLAFFGLPLIMGVAGLLSGAINQENYYRAIYRHDTGSAILCLAVTVLAAVVIGFSFYGIGYLFHPNVKDYFMPSRAPHRFAPETMLKVMGWSHIVLGFWALAPIFVGVGLIKVRRMWMWWAVVIELAIINGLAFLLTVSGMIMMLTWQDEAIINLAVGLFVLIVFIQPLIYLLRKDVRQVFS